MKENNFTLAKTRSKRYLAQTITDAHYADNIELLANTPAQDKSLLKSLEKAAGGISLHISAGKREYPSFNKNQKGDISTLKSGSLKLVDKFTFLRSTVSSSESDINTQLAKAWISIGYRSYRGQTCLIK